MPDLINMSGRINMLGRMNDWIAVKLSSAFSTMACFWLFCVLALLPLPFPKTMPYVQFISSGVLQLVALPLLAVAARVIQKQQAQHASDITSLHAKHDALQRVLNGDMNDGR